MSDITLRLVKGLPLTNQEVDDNFANLNTDKYQAGDSASFQDVTLDNMSGPITWNVDDGTVDVPLNAQVTLQLGQEFVFYAKATEAIANGDVVMFAGAQGGHLLIAKCDMGAAGFDPSHIVGVATQSFAINDFGYVTSSGKVRGIDTSGFTEGDILYVDPTTAGGYTSTKPAPPNHIVQIAAVTRSHATQGTILTRVSHMPDTDEVPEGSTNLYFTDARAVSAIKADGDWNASDWDTAFGWGDHSTEGYLTSVAFNDLTSTPTTISGYGITDAFDGAYSSLSGAPTTVSSFTNDSGYITDYTVTQGDVTAHQAALSITESQISDLGNYLTSFTETDPTVPSHVKSITTTNISNWNTAYGWGDHSTQSYATQTYVNNAVSNLVDSAPSTLDTLNELAAALGDDPNFATTVSNSIGTKWTQDNTKISNWDDAYEQQHSWEWKYITYDNSIQVVDATEAEMLAWYKNYFINITETTLASYPVQYEGHINTYDVDANGNFGGSLGGQWTATEEYHAHIYTNIYVEKPFTVTNSAFAGDDDHALFINGEFVAGSINTTQPSYTYSFKKGWYRIDLIFDEQFGGDYIQLGWNPKDYTSYISDMTPYRGGDNPIYLSDKINAVNNSSNWDTAYGWGNHANAGYLTTHQDISGKADLSGDTFTGMTIFEDGIRIGTGDHQTDGRASLTFGEGSPAGDSMYIEYDGENLSGDSNAIIFGSNKVGVGDIMRVTYGGSVKVGTNSVFHDAYHPNADKWTTARTLSLTGDVTGSVSWDGSANASITTAVANDSHTHDGRYYTESESDSRFARVYKGTATINTSHTTVATISGDRLASSIDMTIQGTSGNVVINVDAKILVNHSQDILIKTESGIYTQIQIKVTSNNNEAYAIEIARVGGSGDTGVAIEIFPRNSETVTFTSSHSFTGSSLNHQTYVGTKQTATGGGAYHLVTDGNISSQTYEVNGTTVIDSSSNLTNIGNISASNINLASNPALDWSSNTITLKSRDAIGVIKVAGNGTYNTRIDITNAGDTETVGRIDPNGSSFLKGDFNLSTGSLQIGGNTVIDTSRNATFSDVTANGEVVSQYGGQIMGVFKGHPNDNHMITIRGNVTGSNTAPVFNDGHQTCFVEHMSPRDDTVGFLFKDSNSNDTNTYTTLTQINTNGVNVIQGGFRLNSATVITKSTDSFDNLIIGSGDTSLRFINNSGQKRIIPRDIDDTGENGTIDLGDNGSKFRALYLSNGIYNAGSNVLNSSNTLLNINGIQMTSPSIKSDSEFAFLTLSSNAQTVQMGGLGIGSSYSAYPAFTGGVNTQSGYQVGGTTVINSNKQFIGNILTSGDGAGNAPFQLSDDYNSWMVKVVPTSPWGLFWAGNSGAAYGTNTVSGVGNIWGNSSNPNEFCFVSSLGTKWSLYGNDGRTWQAGYARADGGFNVNGTTVIDSSRNLTNIGNISLSGQINSTATTVLNMYGSGSETYTQGLLYCSSSLLSLEAPLTSNAAGGAHTPMIFTWRGGYSSQGGIYVGDGYTQLDSLRIKTTGDSGTTVIDSNRNLTNIGSITASSNSNIGGLFLGADGNYGSYDCIGFSGNTNGHNRIFGYSTTGGGMYIASATSQAIHFRTNGSSSDSFRMTSSGEFQVGNTTVIDSSRNATFVNTNMTTGVVGGGGGIGDGRFAVRGGDLIIDRGQEIRWTNATGSGEYIYSKAASPYDVTIHSGSYDSLRCPNNGIVYIAYQGSTRITTTSAGVSVTGALTASGNITAYSDKRKKKDIIELESGLDYINKIDAVRFTWKDSDKKDIGFIAQDVEKHLPEFITDEEIYDYSEEAEVIETVKTMDYSRMTAVLWKAVKEQQTMINELKSEIEELKNVNSN